MITNKEQYKKEYNDFFNYAFQRYTLAFSKPGLQESYHVAEGMEDAATEIGNIAKKFITLYKQYNPNKAALEANFGGDFLKDYIKKEAQNKGLNIHIKAITNTENKELRIERLEIPIEDGEILFHRNQTLLLEQLEQFPDGKNDDLPDALEGAYSLLKFKKKKQRVMDYTLLKPKRSFRL